MRFLCVGKLKCCLVICVLVALASAQVFAAEYTWTGNGASGNWSLAGNWSGSAAPTNDGTGVFTFESNTNGYDPYNNYSGTFSLRKLIFSSGLPAIHHTGNAISFNMATPGGGVYQNSANAVIIDNPLLWTGSNIFYINSQGAGGLTLTGSITGSGGTMAIGLGSVTYSTGTLSTGTSGKLYVGYSGPATLTVQGSATVNVGGELDINYQATRTGDTSTLAISSGALTVTGQTYVGRATMQGGASDYSAKILQTGGTTTFNNLISVGQNGTAKSLFDISAGTANANAGLVVGNQGNGNLNIHGSGSMTVSGGSGLIIGQDSTLATSGTVEQSGGTLTVNGNIYLGNNGGIGTLSRSGGSMSVTGDLIAGGAGTLIVNGTSAVFGGVLSRPGAGTLVIVPSTGNLGSTENVSFTSATNGTLGPWAVHQTSATNTSGDYLKIFGAGHSLSTADYTSTNFAGSTMSSLVNVNATTNLTDNTSAYAIKFGPYTTTISSDKTLSIAGGGIILNGGTVSGGTIAFSDGTTDKMALLYAGTNTPGTISSVLKTNAGLIKFGAGALNLSGASGDLLQGAVMINQGTLNVRDSATLGASGEGNGVTLAAGATLELQGNISVYKTLTLNGSGVGNAGAMRNVQDNNSWTGEVNLASPSQINTVSGQLTLNGQISGNYGLTKTGTGTLALYADNSPFLGTLTVANGILTVQNANSLGSYAAASGTTVNSGATLAIQGNIAVAAEPLTISGTGIGNIGAIKNTQGTNSFAGPITLAADSLININADSLNLAGRIGGNFNWPCRTIHAYSA
jgi:fibronectin-binding autotransporter adhesin